MLLMARRAGEAILIRDDIEIHILSIGRSKVRIGIIAPKEVSVLAREVELVRRENTAAAGPEGTDEGLSRALDEILGYTNSRSGR